MDIGFDIPSKVALLVLNDYGQRNPDNLQEVYINDDGEKKGKLGKLSQIVYKMIMIFVLKCPEISSRCVFYWHWSLNGWTWNKPPWGSWNPPYSLLYNFQTKLWKMLKLISRGYVYWHWNLHGSKGAYEPLESINIFFFNFHTKLWKNCI